MERASRVIAKLTSGGGAIDCDDIARAAWPVAVGKRIAARARPLRMVRTRLIVEVEDRMWQRQLLALSGQILANLRKHLGQGVVDDLEFRVIPPRRESQRATEAQPVTSLDDANDIADPVLRNLYKSARKRATA